MTQMSKDVYNLFGITFKELQSHTTDQRASIKYYSPCQPQDIFITLFLLATQIRATWF